MRTVMVLLLLCISLTGCRGDDAPSPPRGAFTAPSSAGSSGSSQTFEDAEVNGGPGTGSQGDDDFDGDDGSVVTPEAGLGEGNPGPGARDAGGAADSGTPTGTGFPPDAGRDSGFPTPTVP